MSGRLLSIYLSTGLFNSGERYRNNDGVSSSTQTVALTGTGAMLTATASPSALTFAGQLVGSTSTTQTVTLTNTGTVGLNITNLAISGDFTQTSTCGTSLAVGARCSISITFKPAATGSRSGTLTVTDTNNADSGSASTTGTVSLTGTGTAPGVSLSPASLPAFASEGVGSKSVVQTIALSNSGSAGLSVSSIAITGTNAADFSETNTCGTSVAAGYNCTISITFAPAAINSRSATLTITDNNNAIANSVQTVALTGTGTAPEVTVAPGSVPFGGENVGTASSASTITLTNSGNASLAISSITVSGADAKDFVMQSSSTCGTSAPVSAGKNCTIALVFTPSASGSRSATLTITDNANDATKGTQAVALSGTGKDFSISAGSTSATVSPGATASYTLTLAPQSGFDEAVQVTCSHPAGLTGSTCIPSPAALTLNGSSPATVTVNVTTTAASLAPISKRLKPPLGPGLAPFGTAFGTLAFLALLAFFRKRRGWGLLAATTLLVVLWASCGGGGGSSGSGNPGTPAGTYNVTVTVAGGNITQSAMLSLTVQ